MMRMLSTYIHEVWRQEGEGKYADWHSRYYIKEHWMNYFYAAGGHGILPTQQAIEGGHGAQKKLIGKGDLKASPLVVFTS